MGFFLVDFLERILSLNHDGYDCPLIRPHSTLLSGWGLVRTAMKPKNDEIVRFFRFSCHKKLMI